jgi:hypothetical protein
MLYLWKSYSIRHAMVKDWTSDSGSKALVHLNPRTEFGIELQQ